MLKNSTRRMDILVWIFHVSRSNLLCHLYTSAPDIYIPHFYMDFFFVLKNFTNRTDTLISNIHISTCKSSCYPFTCEVYLRVLSTILHGIFPKTMKNFQQKVGHPSVYFPHFHIQLIMMHLQLKLFSSVHSTIPHRIFLYLKKFHPSMNFPRFHI